MVHTFSHDGQQQPDIDQCLTRLADILKALGVREFIIENDYEFHLIDTARDIDSELLRNFCQQMYVLHNSIAAK